MFYVRKSVDNIYFVERSGDNCSIFETENMLKAYEKMYELNILVQEISIKMNSWQKLMNPNFGSHPVPIESIEDVRR